MYKTVDLFAGAGGLSLGFQLTEAFEIVAAAENNPNALKTYKRNHPKTKLYKDVRTIKYGKLQKDLGPIDVVIGGPPCQGFSNANRQKAQAISQNNTLVKAYVKLGSAKNAARKLCAKYRNDKVCVYHINYSETFSSCDFVQGKHDKDLVFSLQKK